MSTPGRLIGSGRRADVYDIGGGRVLRRYRGGPRDVQREAEIMAHVRSHGVAAPEVFDVGGGTDLVMEAVRGPTLLDDLTARPWLIQRHAQTLADLHRLVHAVPPLSALRAPFGAGGSLLHLDLHPLNVIVTPQGPRIIDWESAGQGPAEADVALAWLVMSVSQVAGPVHQRLIARVGQSSFAALFARAAGGVDDRWAHAAAALRLHDPTVTDLEARRVRRRWPGVPA